MQGFYEQPPREGRHCLVFPGAFYVCDFIQERAYILHGDLFTYQKFNTNHVAKHADS